MRLSPIIEGLRPATFSASRFKYQTTFSNLNVNLSIYMRNIYKIEGYDSLPDWILTHEQFRKNVELA
jgi:hypothetical protein